MTSPLKPVAFDVDIKKPVAEVTPLQQRLASREINQCSAEEIQRKLDEALDRKRALDELEVQRLAEINKKKNEKATSVKEQMDLANLQNRDDIDQKLRLAEERRQEHLNQQVAKAAALTERVANISEAIKHRETSEADRLRQTLDEQMENAEIKRQALLAEQQQKAAAHVQHVKEVADSIRMKEEQDVANLKEHIDKTHQQAQALREAKLQEIKDSAHMANSHVSDVRDQVLHQRRLSATDRP
eukprot:GILK01000802.1.p1 GENE.GILK01000802.1~~GILK01000802.1.p1  ORF type:complete len:243 (-),score=62.53 GILK01000802.1:111-839(-)